jgi:hypothetical protein
LRRASVESSLPAATTPTAEPFFDEDRLSPLPDQTTFSAHSQKSSEFARALSRQSTAMAHSNRSSIYKAPLETNVTSPMRSIFPTYDHGRSLDQQHYFPTERAQAQPLPSEKISKLSSPTEKSALKQHDSAVALVDGYEHIPFANDNDVSAIWCASSGQVNTAGRKVQLSLYTGRGTSLLVGPSRDVPLYSMARATSQEAKDSDKVSATYAVEKYDERRNGVPITVSHVSLAEQDQTDTKRLNSTSIFPQAAAVRAIEIVASSPAAAEIATFDPTATSPQAARLAKDALAMAHQRHACELRRTTRKRDSLGAVTAEYSLEHPGLGTLAITVTKSFRSASSREPRAKISIHHPSATPAAIAADTLVLAFIDFARDACILDLPGLLALDDPYIVDTVMCALFVVAAIENTMLNTENTTFEPPPKAPINNDKASKKAIAKAKKSSRWSKRSSRMIDDMQKELVGQPADVSPPVQAVVAVIGFSLKAAVHVIGVGVRVGVKIVERVVSK